MESLVLIKEVEFKYLSTKVEKTLVFRPIGSVKDADTIVFNSNENTYKIIVSPIAGRIRSE